MSLARSALKIAYVLVTTACTTVGVIDNKPLSPSEGRPGYSIGEFARNLDRQSDELRLVVAFSGGGTRAAALSYGVMQELRDTRVELNGKDQSLLDAISVISSVSGGSFTSAYYGLYGNGIFADFEDRFLRRNIEGALVRGILNPLEWFSSKSRTDMAVAYYQQTLFGEATFADLMRKGSPLILINTSDLSSGARFTFAQEYFDLLCSDLTSFSLARAVTASSAVPVVFDPVVVENYGGCARSVPPWLAAAQKRDYDDPNAGLNMIVRNDSAFENRVQHKYAQFVNGGITDNLGLRALVDTIEMAGGARQFLKHTDIPAPAHIAIISVNAAADMPMGIGATSQAPSIENTLDAVTNIQLHRYNVATLLQTQQSLAHWADELSTLERPVTSYFIRLSFEDVPDVPLRRFLNEIPTSFALSAKQVDQLIAIGRQLLRDNPEFQHLVTALQGQGGPTKSTASAASR